MPASNPYAPSESAVIGNTAAYAHDHGQVPAEAVEALRQTRPWVLLLAILGSLITGLMMVGGLLMGGISASADSPAGLGGASLIGMAVGYFIVALVYIYPLVKLFRYSGAISRLIRSGSAADLVDALRHQKSFWRFIAIITCTLLVLYVLFIAWMVAPAVMRR